MLARKAVVQSYFDGFRSWDHGQVVATGNGETTHKSGAVHRFGFWDIFTFAGDNSCRVESFLVPLR